MFTFRSTRPALLQIVKSLCAAAWTLNFPAGVGGGLDTGEPTANVTCHCGQLKTSWKTSLPLDPGTGCTGPVTFQLIMFGLRPGTSSCLSLKSFPGSSTSNYSGFPLSLILILALHRFPVCFVVFVTMRMKPSFPVPVQTPGANREGLPRYREPREHAGEQLPATLHSRKQIQQLALQHDGGGVVTMVIRAGCEDSKVILLL